MLLPAQRGCGECRLTSLLLKEQQIKRIAACDVSVHTLEKASKRLRVDRMQPYLKDKLTLVETPDVPETPDTPDSPTPVDDKTTDEPRTVYDLTAIMGDVDGDGAITASDVLLISRASVGLEKLTDVGRVIADVDGDGKVTTADSLYVLRELVHLYTESKTGDIIHVQSEIDALKLFKDKDEEEKKKK